VLLLLETPARDVELMRTLVAAVAVAVVPVPVPVVVEAVAVERPLLGRPEPQVVIHLREVLLIVVGSYVLEVTVSAYFSLLPSGRRGTCRSRGAA